MVNLAIICFDYGHGGTDPGAVYKDRREKVDNLDIGMMVAKDLRLYGVDVDETRIGDTTVSLESRCKFERKKKYDYFISFHRNAFSPEKARGVETFIYINGNPKAKSLASRIQKSLVGIGFVDRGLKMANFKVLRETLSPAILIELGFIDNSVDNEIFIKKKEEIVESIVRAILDELGIKYINTEKKPDYKEDILYRVVAGSFNIKENAKKRINDLKQAGFDSYMI